MDFDPAFDLGNKPFAASPAALRPMCCTVCGAGLRLQAGELVSTDYAKREVMVCERFPVCSTYAPWDPVKEQISAPLCAKTTRRLRRWVYESLRSIAGSPAGASIPDVVCRRAELVAGCGVTPVGMMTTEACETVLQFIDVIEQSLLRDQDQDGDTMPHPNTLQVLHSLFSLNDFGAGTFRREIDLRFLALHGREFEDSQRCELIEQIGRRVTLSPSGVRALSEWAPPVTPQPSRGVRVNPPN